MLDIGANLEKSGYLRYVQGWYLLKNCFFVPLRSLLARVIHKNRSLPYSRYFQLATAQVNGRPANHTVIFCDFCDDVGSHGGEEGENASNPTDRTFPQNTLILSANK